MADRLDWGGAIGPPTPHTISMGRRFLEDSLPTIRKAYEEHEVVGHCLKQSAPTRWVHEGHDGRLSFSQSSLWYAYSMGDGRPNGIPNISAWTSIDGISVEVDAEIHPSQEVIKQRIRRNPERFDRVIGGLKELTLNMYLKYEHQPRFYHWVSCVRKRSEEFDASNVLNAYRDHEDQFSEERNDWIGRIIRDSRDLGDGQKYHLDTRANKMLNLVTCFCTEFPQGNPFRQTPYDGQLKELTSAASRLKPLLDFFIEDYRQ